jgi:hypothetical protein
MRRWHVWSLVGLAAVLAAAAIARQTITLSRASPSIHVGMTTKMVEKVLGHPRWGRGFIVGSTNYRHTWRQATYRQGSALTGYRKTVVDYESDGRGVPLQVVSWETSQEPPDWPVKLRKAVGW